MDEPEITIWVPVATVNNVFADEALVVVIEVPVAVTKKRFEDDARVVA